MAIRNSPTITQLCCTAALLLIAVLFTILSWQFSYRTGSDPSPVQLTVLILVVMALIYLVLVRSVLLTGASRHVIIISLLAGTFARVCFFQSNPVLETDFYRYLWDGGNIASGVSPYNVVPREALAELRATLKTGSTPSGGSQRAEMFVLERINHPWLTTVYPPVAQAFFFVAHYISPWSLWSWRAVLCVADIITLLLVASTLRRFRLPSEYALIYWWNPILLKELYNSAHMDGLLFPFVIGSLLLATSRHFALSVLCLAFATGVKLWPLILLPLVLRQAGLQWKKLAFLLALFTVVTALIYWPVWHAGSKDSSGFLMYASHWQMNEGLFRILNWAAGKAAQAIHVPSTLAPLAARVAAGCILGVILVTLTVRPWPNARSALFSSALFIVGALFLLSPTQFPWYWLWVLPLVAICPNTALLFYTATLPLYYCRFIFADVKQTALFDWGIVWIEHIPVYLLLILQWWRFKRGSNNLSFASSIDAEVDR